MGGLVTIAEPVLLVVKQIEFHVLGSRKHKSRAYGVSCNCTLHIIKCTLAAGIL